MSDFISRLRNELAISSEDDCTQFAKDITTACDEVERLTAENERYREAIEFAFNNAANSFIGVNFSFDAVKKLREALPDAKRQENNV